METQKTNNQSTSQDMSKPLVLLVDDVPQNVQILHQILNTGEYSFAIATSGEEALHLVEKKPPDLILLDIMLGDTDGFEVCARIKSNPLISEIPIIFLTAKVAVEDKIQGFEVGAVDYITKPFEDAEVLARVRTHIQLKRSIDIIKEYNRQLTETLQEMQQSFNELKQSQDSKLAREKEDTVRKLAVSASHEINQPLTVLLGYFDLLKESFDFQSLNPIQQKYFNRAETGMKKLIYVLEKFRKFSHIYYIEGEISERSSHTDKR